MAEKYRHFDLESTQSTSGWSIKSISFSRRELVLGILVLVSLLVIVILAALLGSANSKGHNNSPTSEEQTSNVTHTTPAPKTCPVDTSCYTPDCLRAASHAFELLNKSASGPCDDFYTFACGNFKRLHPLDPDVSQMTTFDLIFRQNMDKLRRVVEAVSSTEDPHHYESKVKTFYSSCLDHFQRMNLKGTPFLENVVKPSGGWWVLEGDGSWPPKGYSFQDQLEKIHVDFWTDVFFTFSVWPDWLDWNKATIEIYLGGLGLNYHAYKKDPGEVAGYRKYIETVGRLLIRDAKLNVSEDAKTERLNTFVTDALYVESELAEILMGSDYEPDPHALDRRPKLSELNDMSMGVVDWVSLMTYMFNTDTTLVTADSYVVLWEQEYVMNFTRWVHDLDSSNKSRILNNYMIWRLADTYSRYLSWEYLHPFYEARMNRSANVEVPPAWLYCLRQLDRAMEDAMGALFVRDHFSDQNRQTAHVITDYVKKALLESLSNSSHWMSSATRDTGRKKIKESLIKLGYPDYMLSETTLNSIYASLTIKEGDYFGSILSIHAHHRQRWIAFFKKPDDHSVWVYPPYHMVVEYYSPWKELIIPAGMLQFPIFDHSSPGYMNFGSMGSIVGRELTHAVDEFGNQYLLNGSHFGEWWSLNTTAKYQSVRQCMMEAYSSYRMGPFKGYEFLGRLSVSDGYAPYALSESSGIKLAYKGYQKWVQKVGMEPTVPGHNYTNDQMFFISYAQTYCSNRDPEDELFSVWFSDHVTDRIRVNGAVAQLQEFQKAFRCSKIAKMVADHRCSLY